MSNTKKPNGFDIQKIRDEFPILKTEVHGNPLVYLDNGASAQKPNAVINALMHCYQKEYANVHRGLHYLSNAATDAYEKARTKVQKFLNAESESEVIFTSGTTKAINIVAYAWAMPNLNKGDEIILSIAEHHSNIVPWHFLRERQGVKLTFVDCDDQGNIDAQSVIDKITPKTKLIAITHMSNVLGTIVDVKAICEEANKRDIRTLVDGSQAAVHIPVDVQDIGCDWYCITGHKLYGPSGIGALYGKKNLLDVMRPFEGGGEMIEDVTVDDVIYNEPPHRFEAGTPPIAQAIGLGAAVDFILGVGWDNITRHETELRDYTRQQFAKFNGIRIIGDTKNKGAIFSFELEGIHAHDVSMVIDRAGVAVRAGTHCAQPLLTRFGVTSTCRASLAMYNTKDEIDTLIESLHKAKKFFG